MRVLAGTIAAFLTSGVVAMLAGGGCARDEKFPSIGLNVASPSDVAVSASGSHFYALNADFDRTYNQGSLLVMDRDGNKLSAVPLPRMGRSLTVAGNDIIANFDFQDDEDGKPQVVLLDATDPANPVVARRFDLGCSPINAVARAGYPYFFVVCDGGRLYVGEFKTPRADSTLKRVRSYGTDRRALYLDTQRGLLLGFVTDMDEQRLTDAGYEDSRSYDADANEIPDAGPNEVPDEYENSRRALSARASRETFQYFVYDIDREKENAPNCDASAGATACSFPARDNSDPIVRQELRWIYYKLFNFDGTPDPNSFHDKPTYKYYRTNFWSAEPDPSDPNVFYLSHRGPPRKDGSPHANQIVRATFVGDLRVAEDKVPATADALSFERVYGFNGSESSKFHFPGDFEVRDIAGQKLLLVNHFRDLSNWKRGDVYFSLAAKIIDENVWLAETANNKDPLTSWYQTALAPDGRAVAGSFYGNAVMLLEVTPGVGIKELKRIQ
jgi:hypothetical protein